MEFIARALKDILADTHAKGMLSHIINNRKKSSMGFYVTFLDDDTLFGIDRVYEQLSFLEKLGSPVAVGTIAGTSRSVGDAVALLTLPALVGLFVISEWNERSRRRQAATATAREST